MILTGDSSRRRKAGKSGGVVPTIPLEVGDGFTNSLIVEEGENFIFPDWAADATAELFKLIVVSRHGKTRAVEALIRIQVRLVGRDKETAVDVVRAALGGNLNLCAAEATVLGVIGVGEDFYAYDRIFRRCDDRRSAPDDASGADTVDRNAVVLSLLPAGNDLRTVFGLEDAVRTTGLSSVCLSAGKIIVTAATSLRAVTEASGTQLRELQNVASERRHV